VTVPIGDDAAVVEVPACQLAMCCDPVVEGVHFEAATDLALVGRKAVNRNLSDLAAMGAEPAWLLCSIVAPATFGEEEILRLLRGVRAAANGAGAVVIGGDVATARGQLTVTVSAVGRVRGVGLQRGALRVGDTLHVTGPLGGSIAGHHLRFRPALKEGQWLAAQPGVCAAIDVSDGLLLDLDAMLTASGGLGAELDAPSIPVRAAALRLSGGDQQRALDRALRDGEDYCLLFALRRGSQLAMRGPLTARAKKPIGRVVRAAGVVLCSQSVRTRLSISGYEHKLSP